MSECAPNGRDTYAHCSTCLLVDKVDALLDLRLELWHHLIEPALLVLAQLSKGEHLPIQRIKVRERFIEGKSMRVRQKCKCGAYDSNRAV